MRDSVALPYLRNLRASGIGLNVAPGRQAISIKRSVARILGPQGTRTVKRLLGRLKVEEVEIVHAVFAQERARGVMIDVGAHHGMSLGPFAAMGWRIVAFEPDDANRRHLVRDFGHSPDVSIDPRAVAEREAEGLAFYSSDVSTGISGLSAFHESHVQSQTVKATTIASVVNEFSLDRIDFLKIDTEGYDLFVLKGIDWNSVAPEVIVCEFEDRKTEPLGYTLLDMHRFLVERGYEVSISEWEPIVEYGRTHVWKRFTGDPTTVASQGWGNFIAFRDDKRFAALKPENIGALSKLLF